MWSRGSLTRLFGLGPVAELVHTNENFSKRCERLLTDSINLAVLLLLTTL